ncbi:hypothetical protein B0A50_07336 [Salinomyces thailandicus]|uniref:Uncharacterized protein n=1 Tax=Salinomyces thailandicus TaxID=706561 RepID=A0A4V5N3E3_9PEZI|nr:hypothetical protein B0A50_07336 [Salinomyces thailandica]
MQKAQQTGDQESEQKTQPVSLQHRHFIARRRDGDHVGKKIQRQIDRYRTETLDQSLNTSLDITVRPSDQARPLSDLSGKQIGWSIYYFEHWLYQKPMAVQVGVDDEVTILHLGRYVPVTDYLRCLPQVTNTTFENGDSSRKHELQWQWWKTNSKIFPFEKLPSEVRDRIFGFTFGAVIEPYPTHRARRGAGTMFKREKHVINLLLLNKELGNAASKILFLYKTFYVAHLPIANRLLRNFSQGSNLRHLELALSHNGFLKLFGWKFGDVHTFTASRFVGALHTMELHRLAIDIAPPSLTTESPWFDGVCQKIVAGWILEAAWPWVRGHPVEVTGYVKSFQKQAFEARAVAERQQIENWKVCGRELGLGEGTMQEYYEELDEEEGGVSLDGAGGGKPNGSLAVDVPSYPPNCYCLPLCTVGTWDADA